MSHEESKFITIAVPQAEVYTFIYANRKYATWYHNKNVHVGTFSQEAKYAAPCVFQDIFNVKYPLSGAKRVFGFFPGADKCMLSGAKTNDVWCFKITYHLHYT